MISYMMSSSFLLKYTVDTYFKKLLGSPNYKDFYVSRIIITITIIQCQHTTESER